MKKADNNCSQVSSTESKESDESTVDNEDFTEEINVLPIPLSNSFKNLLHTLKGCNSSQFVDIVSDYIEQVGEKGVGQIQRFFEQHPGIDFNAQDTNGHTVLQPGVDNTIHCREKLPHQVNAEWYRDELFCQFDNFLKCNNITKFVELLNDSNCDSERLKGFCENSKLFNDVKKNMALCVAVTQNATHAIDVLLGQPEFEVNSNASTSDRKNTPIMLAAAKGNHSILYKLLEKAKVQSFKPVYWTEVMDQLTQGMCRWYGENSAMHTDRDCDYFKCLKYVFETLSTHRENSKQNLLEKHEWVVVNLAASYGNPICVALSTLLLNSWQYHSVEKFRENLHHLIDGVEKSKDYLQINDVDGNTALKIADKIGNKYAAAYMELRIQERVFREVIETIRFLYGCKPTFEDNIVSPYNEMFLRLASSLKHYFDYLTRNMKNAPHARGNTALDYAVAIGCTKSVVLLTLLNEVLSKKQHELFQLNFSLLISNTKGENINLNTIDVNWNTALHVAAQQNYTNVLDFLLEKQEININARNKQGDTPIMLAAGKGYHNTVLKLLANDGISLDPSIGNKTILHSLFRGMLSIDTQQPTNFQEQDHIKCLEYVFQHLPDNVKHPNEFVNLQIDPSSQTCNSQLEHMKFTQILMLLNLDSEENLGERFKQNLQQLFGDHEYSKVDANTKNLDGNTALHIASRLNQTNVVRFLLSQDEIQVNACNERGDTPLTLAVEKGYHNVVGQLLNHKQISLELSGSSNETILHLLLKAMQLSNSQEEDSGCNYHKCLEQILEKLPILSKTPRSFVNSLDPDGKTALHYATEMKDEKATLDLLRAGSNLHHKTENGDIILKGISPEILSKYLDACVSMNKNTQKISQHQVILDCEIFNVPDRKSAETLMQFLLSLNDKRAPTLRPILTHPVIDAYFSYQWHDKQIHYWCNVIVYVMFCLALNLHLIMLNSQPGLPNMKNTVWVFLAVLIAVLLLRELFQLVMSGWKYFNSSENLIELSLIGVAFHLLGHKDLNSEFNAPITAIILSFCELMLLIGRHPKLSINTEIFKAVTWNFLKLLLQYFPIILAYAFCYYTVINQNQANDDSEPMNKNHTTFFDIAKSTIDAFVMLVNPVNEPDNAAGRLNVTHFLFVLGIFFLTVVLGNLLSGLAVNEIQEIRTNAKRVGIISRMKFLWYVDRAPGKFTIAKFIGILFGVCCNCLRGKNQNNQTESIPLSAVEQGNVKGASSNSVGNESFVRRIFQTLQKKMHPFSNGLPNNKIYILPNDGNIALLMAPSDHQPTDKRKPYSWKIDPDVVECAMRIIEERENPGTDYKQLLEKHSRELEEIKEMVKSMAECKAEKNN